MAGNPNYDAILSTTLKKYTPRLEDNIFDDYPFLNTLKRADNIQKVDGGAHIVEPLLYAQNSTAGSYSGYDSLDTTPQEGITAAEYDWKEFAATIAIANIEEIKNAGVSRVIALLEAKVMQAEMSISDAFNIMLLSDGSGNGGKDWNGIKNFADATPATGTIGGIDSSTETWWRNTAETTVEALALTRLNNTYNTVSKGKDVPTNGFTTQALYEKYESLLQPQLRYSDNDTADAGFLNLLFKSTPVVFDRDIDSGFWYWVNTKYLKLKVHTGTWFKNTPFQTPINQTARYAQILCAGNLVCSNRQRQAVLTGKS